MPAHTPLSGLPLSLTPIREEPVHSRRNATGQAYNPQDRPPGQRPSQG